MTHPFSITLFLPDGHADGIKIIEKPNWSGRGLMCPRVLLFPKHRSRLEFSKPGIYILVGESDLGRCLYIGEGDPILPRLEDHYRKKDWWTDVIAFTSKDEILNKAIVQFLEGRLLREANKSKKFTLDNANQPNDPSLSEIDQSICEGFLREVLLCLPILGINIVSETETLESSNASQLYIRAKGVTAMGFETTEGFVVKSGSYAVSDTTPTVTHGIKSLRQSLIDQKKLRVEADGRLKFVDDYVFGSPSTASSVVLGRSSNGREDWKNEFGVTLKTIQLQNLEQ